MDQTNRDVHGYARISRDPGLQRIGVDRQKREVEGLAERLGVKVGTWHVDNDASAYATAAARPGFDQLLDDVHSGRVSAVLAWDQDRLTRDVAVWERVIAECQRTGTRLFFVTAGEVDIASVSGRLSSRISAVVARHESEHKAERIGAASRERAMNGKAHGPVLYGWRRVYEQDENGVRLRGQWRDVLNEAQAGIIRDAARRVLAGESMKAIARDLNAQGVPTPRVLAKDGSRRLLWEAASLRMLLLRPANAGLRVYQGRPRFEAAAPPILDRGDWERLVAVLRDPRRRTVTDNRVRYLLTGIMTCSTCGRGMRHKFQEGAERYVCPRGCVGRLCAPVDYYVTDTVVHVLSDAERVTRLLSRDNNQAAEASRVAANIRAEMDALTDDRTDGLLDRDQWRRQMERLRPRLDAAERAARSTASRDADVLGDVVGPDAAALFAAAPITRKRSIIEALFTIRLLPLAPDSPRGPRASFDPSRVVVEPRELGDASEAA